MSARKPSRWPAGQETSSCSSQCQSQIQPQPAAPSTIESDPLAFSTAAFETALTAPAPQARRRKEARRPFFVRFFARQSGPTVRMHSGSIVTNGRSGDATHRSSRSRSASRDETAQEVHRGRVSSKEMGGVATEERSWPGCQHGRASGADGSSGCGVLKATSSAECMSQSDGERTAAIAKVSAGPLLRIL